MSSPAGPATRRRGRPRRIASSVSVAPREQILREASQAFSARGLAGTRLIDIAASVGVTPPTLYYYFDNMESIVETLLTYVVDESAAFATAAARRGGPCADRLASLVTNHVERLTRGPYDLWFVVGLTASETARFPAVARRASQWRLAVSRLVAEGVERGEFRPIDRTMAVTGVSGLVYAALQMRHERGSVDAGEIARMAVGALAPLT